MLEEGRKALAELLAEGVRSARSRAARELAKIRTKRGLSSKKKKSLEKALKKKAKERVQKIRTSVERREDAEFKRQVTRRARALRREFFEGRSHKILVTHIRSNTPEWAAYLDLTARIGKWTRQRIRDEFFSPKPRKK
jgi:hypothetical protein